jgi:hypothetical protein
MRGMHACASTYHAVRTASTSSRDVQKAWTIRRKQHDLLTQRGSREMTRPRGKSINSVRYDARCTARKRPILGRGSVDRRPARPFSFYFRSALNLVAKTAPKSATTLACSAATITRSLRRHVLIGRRGCRRLSRSSSSLSPVGGDE